MATAKKKTAKKKTPQFHKWWVIDCPISSDSRIVEVQSKEELRDEVECFADDLNLDEQDFDEIRIFPMDMSKGLAVERETTIRII